MYSKPSETFLSKARGSLCMAFAFAVTAGLVTSAYAEHEIKPAPEKAPKATQTEVLNAPATPPAAGAPADPAAEKAATPAPVAEAPKTADAKPADSAEKAADAGKAEEPQRQIWPFTGMTGHLDKQAAQRGFQVYKQVCSACHSMNLVAYRSLAQLGFEEGEIKAIAAEKQVPDFDEKGEPVQRPAKPFDKFVAPFPNEDASRAANGGAYPPDLSLIIKARENGPDYVYSLLTGFSKPPAGVEPVANKYYNPYFTNHWISMPPPLNAGALEYQDGTNASVDQMAHDVVVFLQWAAEPETQERHEMGIKVLIFLVLMTGFFIVAKRRVWKDVKH